MHQSQAAHASGDPARDALPPRAVPRVDPRGHLSLAGPKAVVNRVAGKS